MTGPVFTQVHVMIWGKCFQKIDSEAVRCDSVVILLQLTQKNTHNLLDAQKTPMLFAISFGGRWVWKFIGEKLFPPNLPNFFLPPECFIDFIKSSSETPWVITSVNRQALDFCRGASSIFLEGFWSKNVEKELLQIV